MRERVVPFLPLLLLLATVGMALVDFDQDGLANYQEIQISSSWIDKDSDNDGLLDLLEFQLGLESGQFDSDGDGLGDAYEVLTLGTDPLLVDSDGDGVSDFDEIQEGTNPQTGEPYRFAHLCGDNVYGCDLPCVDDEDCDGDGLLDGTELRFGSFPGARDTDRDGIIDGHERHRECLFLADCDGDEVPDAQEVERGLSFLTRSTDGVLPDLVRFLWGSDAESLTPDLDRDGLPDAWEVDGFWPALDVQPGLRDLAIRIRVPYLDDGPMAGYQDGVEAQIEAAILEVREMTYDVMGLNLTASVTMEAVETEFSSVFRFPEDVLGATDPFVPTLYLDLHDRGQAASDGVSLVARNAWFLPQVDDAEGKPVTLPLDPLHRLQDLILGFQVDTQVSQSFDSWTLNATSNEVFGRLAEDWGPIAAGTNVSFPILAFDGVLDLDAGMRYNITGWVPGDNLALRVGHALGPLWGLCIVGEDGCEGLEGTLMQPELENRTLIWSPSQIETLQAPEPCVYNLRDYRTYVLQTANRQLPLLDEMCLGAKADAEALIQEF